MSLNDKELARFARSLGGDIFVVGLTWSDEGKGKVADEIACGAAATVRWHGGASAGHNVRLPNGQQFHLHNLPCGVLHPDPINLVGPLCVLDPELVRTEAALSQVAYGGQPNVVVDRGARIVLPAHKLLDAGREGASGAEAYGTTKTGMGPAHEDLVGRKGLIAADLAAGPKTVRLKLQERRYYQEKQALASFWGVSLPSLEETVAWCVQFQELFAGLIGDTRAIVNEVRRDGRTILWEGAHGAMIDVVNGTMPTSSLVSPWSAHHCYGPLGPDKTVVGTFRPYVTRTGPGPMPTEMAPEDAQRLHQDAGEIESTTGRLQRCGWLDLVAVSYTARLTGTNRLYLTKMDVTPFETLKVCCGYQIGQHLVSTTASTTLTADRLSLAKPMYRELEGWDGQAVAAATTWSELPPTTRRFIDYVETLLQLPVIAIGNGPNRGDYVLTGSELR
jgi:adenylosuccinate synthase